MSCIVKIRKKTALCMIAIFMVMLIFAALAPVAAYAADATLSLKITQVFTTSSPVVEATFSYRFKPLEPGAPMPVGSTAEGYTFTLTGNYSLELPIIYTQQGVFRYELFQVIGAEKPGYIYDKRVYKIEAYVGAGHNVEIIIANGDGTKAKGIEFKNGFNILPSDRNLMVDPPVVKSVTGYPRQDSVFVFRLSAWSALQPMPAGSFNGVKTISIVGSGQAEFGTWSYDKAGTYYYTVYEVNTGERGYDYDSAVYTITDTVAEANGQLVLSRIVTNSMNKQVRTLTFINRYSSGGASNQVDPPRPIINNYPSYPIIDWPQTVTPISIVEPDSGNGLDKGGGDAPIQGTGQKPAIYGPKTGDNLNTTMYILLFTIGSAITAGSSLYLIMGIKRKKARC